MNKITRQFYKHSTITRAILESEDMRAIVLEKRQKKVKNEQKRAK